MLSELRRIQDRPVAQPGPGQVGWQFRGIEPGQGADRVAVLPGDDGVADDRCRREQRCPQGANPDEGAGGQLEIFGQPPPEQQSPGRVGRVCEADRVPRAVEALVIEGGPGQVGRLR